MKKIGRVRANPVQVVNTELTRLASQLRGTTAPFGEALQSLDGVSLNDTVVCHRIVGKFFEPIEGLEQEQHRNAVQSMVSHDERGFKFTPTALAEVPRKAVYGARNTLSDWLAGLKPTYRFRPPSGESALSNAGLTDVYYKLEDTSHWEVSVGALPYAAAICYNHVWLKRLVKSKFKTLEPTGKPFNLQKQEWFLEARTQSKASVGFYVFKKMFTSLCTLNEVSRITSIYKDARGRRVISMVPFWNMVCQLSYMGDIRDMLDLRLGYNLKYRADLHKTLLPHRSIATIDLRNASNSVWQCVVDFLFPNHVRKVLDRLVDKHYEYSLTGTDDDVQYGHFNMFAPMGCGLTFDVMTLMLLAVGRQLHSGCTVFGDDIMIHQDSAAAMMQCIEAMGLEVNTSKSFVVGNFSESCGGYYNHATQERIVCYDFKWAETRQAAFAIVNKLGRIIRAGQVSPALRLKLEGTHQRILDKLAHYAVASTFNGNIPSGYIEDDATYSRGSTAVSRLIQEYWQRRVDVVPISTRKAETQEQDESPALLASWFHRMESYDPNTAKATNQVTMCDAFSQGPLNEVLLVSLL